MDIAEPLTGLTLTLEEWSTLDAYLDNTVAVAAVDGPPERVSMGSAIRARISEAGANPPDPQKQAPLTVNFSVLEIRFLFDQASRWHAVESLESAEDDVNVGMRVVLELGRLYQHLNPLS